MRGVSPLCWMICGTLPLGDHTYPMAPVPKPVFSFLVGFPLWYRANMIRKSRSKSTTYLPVGCGPDLRWAIPSFCSFLRRSISIVCTVLVLGSIASANQETNSKEQFEFFEKRVRPILVERCYECHGAKEASGGLRLDHRDGLIVGGDSGAALVPNNPDASLMVRAVKYSDADLQMPPTGAIPATEIAVLEEWIRSGAADPRDSIPELENNKPTGMSIADGKEFWSMLPLSDPAIPQVRDADWVQSPIDAFVLERLERLGIAPAPRASRRDLLRRMTLDLTGVPPTMSELQALEADASEGSIERCIDRLLSSPQYGVRFGRHWLDVARYADSNGLDENIAYGNAWRYRDYVIDSFNGDKPFDRFLEEQIAGDLLPDASRETVTGTGFLVLGAKVLAEPDRDKLVMDTIDEQLDAIGKCFMGMTLGCVRCHDHKFDPIKQRDYYALAAIFKGTKTFGDSNFGAIKHWNEISYASPEEKASLTAVNAKIAEKQAAFNTAKSGAMQKLRERVRSQAALYLATAAKHDSSATLNEWALAGAKHGLHPRVLAHCRKHLEFHTEDPLFDAWRDFASQGDLDAILCHYESLFDATQRAWVEAKNTDPKVTGLSDPLQERARVALNDVGGFLAIPAKMEHALDEVTVENLHALATEARLIESSAPDETAVMGVSDRGVIEGIPIHIRGSHRNLGDVVRRDFPEVMRAYGENPVFNRRSSGRLELAKWLSNPNHPLTARVIVNRVWRWHFGRGLVSSTENFGRLGDRPSHPELLDFLARWFIESGWSVKELNRLIMSSSVYQMASQNEATEQAMAIDPENQSLWRFRTQRLSAEQIRDSILFVAGNLDLRLGGKSVPLRNRQFVFDHTSIDHTRYDSVRRTVYLPIIRNHLFSHLEQFDFPDPTMPGGDRQSTTVAPQSLLLMNSEWVLGASENLARACLESTTTPEGRLQWLYHQVLNREATDSERNNSLAFVDSLIATGDPSPNIAISSPNGPTPTTGVSAVASIEQKAWGLLAQNLLICNEFFFAR